MSGKRQKSAMGAICKRILSLLPVLVLIAALLVLSRGATNKLFLRDYDRGVYAEYPENLVLPVRLGENYVVPYNLGNVAYQRGDYNQAIRYYATALREEPPAEEKECGIRVNLALAVLQTFPFETLNTADTAQVNTARETLLSARSVLTETGCACPEKNVYDGHSQEAESLKRDIDQMLDRLASPPPRRDDSPQNNGGEGPSDSDQQDEQQDESEQDQNSGGGDGQTQEEKQQALQQQLEDQKQQLDTGSYQNSGYQNFTYINIGDSFGYGEGAPW